MSYPVRIFACSPILRICLLSFIFWNSTNTCVIGIAGQSIVCSSFIPVALIDSAIIDFTSSSLLSALNPCSIAQQSVGTYHDLLCALSPWLHLESVVPFFHGTYPFFQVCKLFFDFSVDMSLQAFDFFVCLQVTFM